MQAAQANSAAKRFRRPGQVLSRSGHRNPQNPQRNHVLRQATQNPFFSYKKFSCLCSTQTPGVVFLISPCSIRKNAPILLTASGFEAEVNAYITANLKDGGTVYVLGGESAVPSELLSVVSGVKRLTREDHSERRQPEIHKMQMNSLSGLKRILKKKLRLCRFPILKYRKRWQICPKNTANFVSPHRKNKLYLRKNTLYNFYT